ncbi:hypothetical protein N7455_005443 [Penicillium solitum]|uniref:uncharacterized protein n=1 Tax=Penicillium solitum TaxID=60172 RepID=UPI0032C45339|nr:hypothetical protein N7536_000779 [Penicillium majusculum]KAJ5870502.1 hypothetical protein N7455_005443 [Penicillium solitum]
MYLDYVHGPIKATKDKTFHGKREAQLLRSLSFSSCLFLPFSIPLPERRPLTPSHNWYVSTISLELHQGVF